MNSSCKVLHYTTGVYTGDTTPDDEAGFLCERSCLADLLEGLKAPCPCGVYNNPWSLDSVVQVNFNPQLLGEVS